VEPDARTSEAIAGAEATVEWPVTPAMTAMKVGTGEVNVLSTWWVLALVERAAVDAVAPHLPEGATTVGARVDLIHAAPSVVGMQVRAHARADSVEGRKIRFSFEVSDEAGEVARGTHLRVIVDREAFERTAVSRTRSKEQDLGHGER
jgi:fluoroacetyl-CoA thioesterase